MFKPPPIYLLEIKVRILFKPCIKKYPDTNCSKAMKYTEISKSIANSFVIRSVCMYCLSPMNKRTVSVAGKMILKISSTLKRTLSQRFSASGN
jgi:hypothetical protein